MEWLPPRIADPAQIELAGAILEPAPGAGANASLRQKLYAAGFQWRDFIAFASGQDILPPLIWALRTRNLLLPAPKAFSPSQAANFITARLNEAFDAHLARRQDLLEQLLDCLRALNKSGIRPVILKGARYLLDHERQWQSARPMRDIDLLIAPEQSAEAMNALAEIGYVADLPSGVNSHHLPELRKAGRHGVVELHTEALAPAGARFMSTAFVRQMQMPVEAAGAQALVLPPVWQALHALLHHQASDDGYRQHVIALKPLWEFSCLASTFGDAEWRGLAEKMLAPEAADVLASWCLQAGRIFNLAYPAFLAVSDAARTQVTECFRQAMEPEVTRRARFLKRQLARGFSRETLAERYGVAPRKAGLVVRGRHLWFLLRRYRGKLGARLFGRL